MKAYSTKGEMDNKKKLLEWKSYIFEFLKQALCIVKRERIDCDGKDKKHNKHEKNVRLFNHI
jgi:hypothetical protein